MLVPPVAQGGTGARPVGDSGPRAQQSSGPATAAATLWPLAPAQPNQLPNQQSQATPPLAATPAPAHNQGVNRYGLYSLFPGGGGGSYVAATPATPAPPTPARAYHATTHKVSESVFSAAVGVGVGGYTWGAPTPPPGSPYSPVPVTQLELLAKNLASLAPTGQQALSLQSVGVNVGSLHHAQHTQHTQHTLNLAGLHHLHHGGIHQSTFSPQLSLVTGAAPTLTINSFSSPNSAGNVVPTTGVLLQEYQSPTTVGSSMAGGGGPGGCAGTMTINGSSCSSSNSGCPSSTTTTTTSSAALLVQPAQNHGQNGPGQLLQPTTKKREAFLPSQGQPVKLENKSTRQPCVCRNGNGKTKTVHSDAGCSRTLPVASSWNGQDSSGNNVGNNVVKREPLSSVPCQVAEVSTSLHATATAVKIEPLPPKSENGIVVSNAGAGGIPVGIAVARQRLQHQETSSASMRNVSLSHHTSHHASYHHFQPDTLGSGTAMTVGGATTLVQCGGVGGGGGVGGSGGDDRPAHLAIPSGAAAAAALNAALGNAAAAAAAAAAGAGGGQGLSSAPGLNSPMNSNLQGASAAAAAATAAPAPTWPPTLWQYPAAAAAAAAAAVAAAAAMPMEPVGFPQMGVGLQGGGLQLVRDPTTGHLLLIHAAEQMQQAVVWPNYSSHNAGNVAPPPLLLPPPPPPAPAPPSLQLLGDIGGARLVLTESKRKQQSAMPIVKIEADCAASPTTIITSTESTKALQTMTTGTLVPETPLVTTLHYYPHAPALVQISQAEPTHCRSQQRSTFLSKATSPVSCLTPPPEVPGIHSIEPAAEPIPYVGVQDASNQTDAPEPEIEEQQQQHQPQSAASSATTLETTTTTYVKQEQNPSPCQMQSPAAIAPGNIANLANFEFVAAAPEKVCNVVRITTTTTTVNPTVCGIVGKVDKAENTVINMADCPKYSITKECRTQTTHDVVRGSVTSIDRTIEHVVSRHMEHEPEVRPLAKEQEDEEVFEEQERLSRRDPVRSGPRIIEITEENCDSFHENLEFFGRRRDYHRERRRSYVQENSEEQENAIADKKIEDISEVESKIAEVTKVEEEIERKVLESNSLEAEETKMSSMVESSGLSVSPQSSKLQGGIIEQPEESSRPHIVVKSFDMPSIDYEEQEVDRVVVKQEAEDTRYEDCVYNARCEPSSTTEKPKCQDKMRYHLVEKSHPGIENVVEKLKKNAAAAMQESTSLQKIEEGREKVTEVTRSRRHPETVPRKLENGLKKHILRFCENSRHFESQEDTDLRDAEVSSSENVLQEQREYPKTSCVGKIPSSAAECLLNDNNNDSRSNNNNIKMDDVERGRIITKKEKLLSCSMYGLGKKREAKNGSESNSGIQNKEISSEEISSPSTTTESNMKVKVLGSKQKPTVDLSGLELLSNSIEQLEHLKPETPSGSVVPEIENSPAKANLISQQGEGNKNNNNVDSPLGLLCALAEQRLVEEVGDDVPRKLNLDSPDEIYAGRLLLNLGGINVLEQERKKKRKYAAVDEESPKRLKQDEFEDEEEAGLRYYETSGKSRKHGSRLQEELVFRVKEKTRRNINFSEENGTDVEEGSSLKDKPEEVSGIKSFDQELKNPIDLRSSVYGHEEVFNERYSRFHQDENCYEKMPVDGNVTDSDTEVTDIPEEQRMMEEHECIDENNEAEDYASLQENLQMTNLIDKQDYVENEADWPNMDAMEMDMRVRLADIQRQYRQKQRELSKLTPKKEEGKSPGRPRKKSHSSSSEHGPLGSPPTLEPVTSPRKSPAHSHEGTPPPLTSAVLGVQRCNVNLIKVGEPRSHIKLLDSIPSIPIPVPPVASPITVLPTNPITQEDDEKSIGRLGYDTSSPAPTVASSSSASKKRKVGRPRKLMCTSGSARHLTETIVAKKPKSKSSLVGYLLSSKNRHLQTKYVGKTGYTPLPFKTGLSSLKASSKSHKKSKVKAAKQTPLHNKNVISSIIAEKAKLSQEVKIDKQLCKAKPKLKAEAKVKTWEDEDSSVAETLPPETIVQEPVEVPPPEVPQPVVETPETDAEKWRHEKSKKKKRKSSSSSPNRHKSGDRDRKESKRRKSSECKECKECAKAAKAERTESIINRCKLTSAHLAIDQLRVLTAMGGLFYAGRLSAVQAPDVYAITVDGERGNKPHIHSREEILRDAIVEVCPSSTKELPPGTRLCAYWSQQYRCLYPGTSVEPTEPDPELDEKFVSVEFDDGDSGRIALDDIRLLQPDYPVVEYDPNPLLSLGKRRRQTSQSTEDKRSSATNQCSSGSTNAPATSSASSTSENSALDRPKTEDCDAKAIEDYHERKRLKKRRRDKLKRLQEAQEGKKKHRKHRCCEEHRKHKHRKHRKHKHKHSHHSSHSEGSHISSGESCCGQKSEEEQIKETSQKAEEEEEDEEISEKPEEPEIVPEPVEEVVKEEKPEKQKKPEKKAKPRERQESIESRSKMAAFLPARQLWGWAGKGYRRPGAKGRAKKQFFRAIQRGSESIQIGDSAVFLSTGRPDRPYIGRIESMWETSSSNMIVKVKWFYHPEETVGCPNLKYPGALFQSPHMDENDVQTISHKCEVLPLQEYTEKLGKEPHRYLTIYDNNDIYYLAGYYDPTTYLLTMQPGVV